MNTRGVHRPLQPLQPADGDPDRRQLHVRRRPAHRQRHAAGPEVRQDRRRRPHHQEPELRAAAGLSGSVQRARLGLRLTFLRGRRAPRARPRTPSLRPAEPGCARATSWTGTSLARAGAARRLDGERIPAGIAEGAGTRLAVWGGMFAPCRLRRGGGNRSRSIDVEVDVAVGLPCCNIVGLADAGVREGRVRIRGALENSGFKLPPRRITVNLAPADLRKDGAAYDVPIAVGMLSAAGVVDAAALAARCSSASWRSTARCARARGPAHRRLGARPGGAAADRPAGERRRGGGGRRLRGSGAAPPRRAGRPAPRRGGRGLLARRHAACRRRTAGSPPDLGDVRGQEVPRRALEIAAAGGHNLLFVGAPGSGKTMLAQRLGGILPPLTFDEALETTMVYSRRRACSAGRRWSARARSARRTIRCRRAGLVGGGPRPAQARSRSPTTASCSSTSCWSIRARCWRACASRSRIGASRSCAPGAPSATRRDFMLVAALNPCPCGYLGSAVRTCTCSSTAIGGYRARLSGPLVDRIDLHVDVPALPYHELAEATPGESTRRRARRGWRPPAQRQRARGRAGTPASARRRSAACADRRRRACAARARRPAPRPSARRSPASGGSPAPSPTSRGAPPSAPCTSPRPCSTACSTNP